MENPFYNLERHFQCTGEKGLMLRKEARNPLITVLSNSIYHGGICREWLCCSPWEDGGRRGESAGKVILDGKIHEDKGLKCTDCYTKVFPMKKGTKITMAEINEGKYCGVCHNGQRAFKSSEQANCEKCLKK